MPNLDSGFMQTLEKGVEQRHRTERQRRILIGFAIVIGFVALGGIGLWWVLRDPNAGRTLPPELPPPSTVAQLPVSKKAEKEAKTYWEAHPEIRSALAEIARQISRGEIHLEVIGPQFQPVANFTWEKWYYDTVPVREGFKTHKEPQPTPHPFTEERSMITYTILPEDRWGAWGVGIKYAAALGVDLNNEANQNIGSLVAAYVWLQAQNRMIYAKSNYFDDKGNYDPKRPRQDINVLHPGDQILFPHLGEEGLRELLQNPVKYLEGGTMPPASDSPPTAPPATPATS